MEQPNVHCFNCGRYMIHQIDSDGKMHMMCTRCGYRFQLPSPPKRDIIDTKYDYEYKY